jgi:hypothetical protein
MNESINNAYHIIFKQFYKCNVPSLTHVAVQNFKDVYLNNTYNSKPYSVFKFST